MNNFREVNSQGSVPQDINMQRSIFDRSNTLKTTFNAGKLIPFYLDEVYPGDTINIDPHFVLRQQTPLTPVMDNANLDMYWFFVPNRIIWKPEFSPTNGEMSKGGWKEFMGENNKGSWIKVENERIPEIAMPAGGWKNGSLADYLGLPVNQTANEHPKLVNALPFRAYCEIWNQYFRDQNYQEPCRFYRGTTETIGTNVLDDTNPNAYIINAGKGGDLCPVSKYKDYFTSCLPSPLKHVPITAKVNVGNMPVVTRVGEHDLGTTAMMFRHDYNTPVPYGIKRDTTTGSAVMQPMTQLPANEMMFPSNLYAISSEAVNDLGIRTNPEINIQELRDAWAKVKIYERDARHGTRYNELLKAHYGVASPDLELERPEYLGGNRTPINISQVLQTTQGTDATNKTLGATGAVSYTASDAQNNSGAFTKSFTEHGYVMGLMCVRQDHTYYEGENRLWHRKERLDFYTPELANISEQPVYTREIYSNFPDNYLKPNIWGYQEAWAELRYKPNQITGLFREWIEAGKHVSNLSMWHYGDFYGDNVPHMSGEWLMETPKNIDRTTVLGSQMKDKINQYMIDMYFKATYVRVLPTYSVPSLVDHL